MYRIAALILSLTALALPAQASGASTTATALLAQLPVAADQPMTGYSRDQFKHWVDADHDGCDTRKEVLAAESLMRPRPPCARTSSGLWFSPYDGKRYTRSRYMDIDHMVPLAESWRSGASKWDAGTRQRFANDEWGPALIAVSATSNRSKGDKDPAAWLPPRRAYRCTYLTSWVTTKWRWQLTVGQAEHDRIANLLRSCTKASQTIVKPARPTITLAPVDDTDDTNDDTGTGDGATDPQFATCAEAIAAGYGPYFQGDDPEYAWYTDGDGDGVVCE
jgi:hypothetical protein